MDPLLNDCCLTYFFKFLLEHIETDIVSYGDNVTICVSDCQIERVICVIEENADKCFDSLSDNYTKKNLAEYLM